MIDASEHLGLVEMMLGRAGVLEDPDLDEFRGAATIALVRAARHYDTGRGLAFSTYACRAIELEIGKVRQYLHRAMRDRRRTVAFTDRVAVWEGALDPTPYAEVREEVDACLSAMDERGRHLMTRRAMGGTLEEIGAELGVSKEGARYTAQKAVRTARAARAGAAS